MPVKDEGIFEGKLKEMLDNGILDQVRSSK